MSTPKFQQCAKCSHTRNIHYEPSGDDMDLESRCLFKGCDCEYFSESGAATSHTPAPHDPVNHPSHYTSHPSGVEAIVICEHFSFCIGNAMKYMFRAGLKGKSLIEDLEKAKWYISREIERLTKAKGTP